MESALKSIIDRHMSRYRIAFILIFSFQFLFSQAESGTGIYRIVFPEDSQMPRMGVYKDDIKNILKKAKSLRFQLVFDQTGSMFSLVKDLQIDENDFGVKMATVIFGADKAYYTNIVEGYFIEEKQIFDKAFSIVKHIDKENWELTPEKKVINGHECYKATGKRTLTGKSFNKKTLDIVAWYCPEIPLKLGPFEAVGLPGLVVQLDLKGHSIILDHIQWDKNITVENDISGELVSEKEFDSIFKKMVKVRMPN